MSPPTATCLPWSPQASCARNEPSAAPCIDACAEALPLPDGSFDAAMAILSLHHWTDWTVGLRELRRVAYQRVVILTYDPAHPRRSWLMRDYLPELAESRRPAIPADRGEGRRPGQRHRHRGSPDPTRLPRRLPRRLLAPPTCLSRPRGPGRNLNLPSARCRPSARRLGPARRRPRKWTLGAAQPRHPELQGARPRPPAAHRHLALQL